MSETMAINVRLPIEDIRRLDELSKRDERSRNYMLKKAVRFFLDHQEGPPEDPEPHPNLQVLPTGVPVRILPQLQAAAPTAAIPVAEVSQQVGEEAETMKNLDPIELEEEERLKELREKRKHVRNGREDDELRHQIEKIEYDRTMRFLEQMEKQTS